MNETIPLNVLARALAAKTQEKNKVTKVCMEVSGH
jgi:hypothetical protein